MNLMHDSADPDDPIVTSALLWLVFPVAMCIEVVRSVRLRRAESRPQAFRAGASTTTQTS